LRLAMNVDFELDSATGVSRYGTELARSLSATGHLRELWVGRDRSLGPGGLGSLEVPVEVYPFPRRVADWFWPALRARRSGLDAVISPGGSLLPRPVGPQAAMVHDLGPFLLPSMKAQQDTRTWQRRIERTVKKAALITVNSQSTLSDLEDLFPEACPRAAVTPLGIDHFPRRERSGRNLHLLAVGTVEPRKNYQRLIRAYRGLAEADPGAPPLVIAGMDGYRASEVRRLPRELGIESRVRFTGYVSEDRLQQLYADAACLVHPALKEGFGFTVAEAFSRDLPVAAASGSAIEEYFAGAVDLFDPESIPGMTSALELVLRRGVTDRQREERERLRAELTWKRCAAMTVAALERVL